MHHSRVALLVIDVPEQERSGAEEFWSQLTGRTVRPGTRRPEYSVLEPPRDVGILIQAIQGSARYHVDVHTDDLDAESRRVLALGAEEVSRTDNWVVFTTPGGLLVCIVEVPPDHASLQEAQEFDS